MLRLLSSSIFSLILIMLAYAVLYATLYEPREPHDDEYRYMGVAYNVATHGVFSGAGVEQTDRTPDAFNAPLYPAMLGWLMQYDRPLNTFVTCMISAEDKSLCELSYNTLVMLQYGLLALTLWFVWLVAFTIAQSGAVAWMAVMFAGLSGKYFYYASTMLTENLIFPLAAFLGFALVMAWQSMRGWWFFAAGIALGLLALTKPSYAYLWFGLTIGLPLLAMWCHRYRLAPVLGFMLILSIGYGLTVAPWMYRNWKEVGAFAITHGYASNTLAQRISYNRMTSNEYLASFVYWFPDFGDTLVATLFDEKDYERLHWEAPNGFYKEGTGSFAKEMRGKAEDARMSELDYLIKEELLPDIGKHLAVTVPLMWRGLFVAKYWGVVTMVFFVIMLWHALHSRWTEFVVLALPPWFMLAFHAFVSVGITRYNLIMVPLLAIATAIYLHEWYERRVSVKRRKAPLNEPVESNF